MVIASIPLVFAWDFEPIYVVPLLALTALYLALVGPLRARYWPHESVSRQQVTYFLFGAAALAIGLWSPINFIAMEYLLTAHMIQHVLFTVVGPPLVLLGVPGWLVEPLFRGERMRRIGRALTHPVTAFGVYNLNMWVWHAPAFLDAVPSTSVFVATRLLDTALLIAALLGAVLVGPTLWRAARGSRHGVAWVAVASVIALGLLVVSGLTLVTSASWAVFSQPHNPIHTLMDGMFIVAALLYWSPILNPVPQLRRIAPLFGMLYLFMSAMPMMALGAMMVLSSGPLYHLYASAPRIFGGSALGDQQLGGLIMWLIMDIPLLAGITILFFRWMSAQERDKGQLTTEEQVIWEAQQARFSAEQQR